MRKRNHTPPPLQAKDPVIGLSRRTRVWLTAFIAFNLFAIVTWCMPLDTPLTQRFRSFVRPYLVYTGLFQKWDMFAPDPSKLNNFIGAMITYNNGDSKLWTFPRMENLGYVDKYFEERFRKYANDCLRLDDYSALWPDAARYIARVNNRTGNPPVGVQLIRYWSIVPPPGANGEETQPNWNQYAFYRYQIQPGDLP